MTQSEYKVRQVRAKTNEVFEYDHDDEKPGKPLHILIPGGLIALITLGVMILVGYQTWVETNLNQSLSTVLLVILFPFYVGGVFLFSYGYELYNIPRALRLTAIIVFITVFAVVIVAVLFVVFSNSKGGGSSSSSRSSSRSSSKSSGSAKVSAQGNNSGLGAAGMMAGSMVNKSSSNSSSGGHYSSGPVFIGSGGRTRVETREVTKEVVKEVPKEPMPITCPFCTRSYVPVDQKYVCPSCGAATPKELIEELQVPKSK